MLRKLIISILIPLLLVTSSGPGLAFTIGEEKKVGEQLLFSIRRAFTVIDDPDITEYINDLGAEVLDVAGIQYFDYRFYIIEDKEFNAFAAPSGLIFFHSGLIETMNSEDELISVLAHEIGHIVKRHLASRIKNSNIVNIASLAVALGSLALGDAKATAALLSGSLAAGQAAQLSFSRQNEEEADLLAYEWMKKLDRTPHGQEKMLQTMRRITRYRMGQVPQYLLTHPDPEARLDYVQSLIAAESKLLPPVEVTENDFAFLRFKYRVLSQVENQQYIRQFLASKIANGNSSAVEIIMAKYGISQLDRQQNNYQKSLKHLEEVINYFPSENILKIDQGNIELEAGFVKEAIGNIQKIYQLNLSDNYAAYSLAQAYLKDGKLNEARKLFEQVALSMEEYSAVYYDLGKIASLRKEKGQAAYYLGVYNLYEGKLKLAKFNFDTARKDPKLEKKYKDKIPEYMKTLERLIKG